MSTTSATFTPAILVLADGRTFRGQSFGATDTTFGEAVFNTAMTGYQEILTDPSNHRQIVVAATPQIGNTGWNDEDSQSRDGKIWAAGYVIRDLSNRVSNWRAQRSLEDEMIAQNITGIQGIDTRTVVRRLRNEGSIAAGIFTGENASRPVEELVAEVKAQPSMAGSDLVGEVTTSRPYTVQAVGEKKYTVVAYDMGIRSATPNELARRGIDTVVVPANTPIDDVKAYHPDGVLLSNGPGDPATADAMVEIIKQVLRDEVPLFGMGLGNQLLGRALGLETFQMAYGHRGINIPVINHLTSRIDITSQNHGFALKSPDDAGDTNGVITFDTEFGPAQITHTCLNDDTAEGVALANGRAYSVQYHPESATGPHDANPLFDQFLELMDQHSPNK